MSSKINNLNRLDQLYIFVLIVISGFGISFFRGIEGFLVIALFNVLVLISHKLSYSFAFYKAVFIWFLYCVAVGLLFQDFSPFFILRTIVYLSIAYTLASFDRRSLLKVFVKIVYILSAVSLLFYGVHVLFESVLYELYNNYGIDTYFEREYYQYTSIYKSLIFYTYSNLYALETILPRNYGFCWEPGPFAVFVLIAIYFNTVLNNFKFRINKVQLILILTLISTQSTTGLIGFLILYLYIIVFKSDLKASKLLAVPVFIIFIAFLYFSSEIFYEKVDTQLESATKLEETLDKSARKNIAYSAGRFGGFVIAWNDFKNSPIVGIGDSKTHSLGGAGGSKVYIVNGLASILSMYGIFGLLVFVFYLRKSSSVYSLISTEGKNFKYSFFIIMIISYFSFSFQVLPIIFSLTFISIFTKSKQYD